MQTRIFLTAIALTIFTIPTIATAAGTKTWYKPKASATWQWQLNGKINTKYAVDVYDVDLFDTSTKTIKTLKASGKKVICYFSAGSSENWRSDFKKIAKASMGKSLDGWAGEKWLDIRAKNVIDVMTKRLDLAVTKGCDGVEPDNVDGYSNKTGFPLTANDQLIFNKKLAEESHKRGLAIALKNDVDQVAELVDSFDMTVNEQCHEFNECDKLAPFTKQDKPIFNAEYENSPKLCTTALKENIRTLVMPLDLDDSSRKSCD